MTIKNITYQRVLNLGNYESKRLELSAEILEGDDPNEEISRLMEKVEQKIREETELILDARDLRKEINELKQEL